LFLRQCRPRLVVHLNPLLAGKSDFIQVQEKDEAVPARLP